MFRVIGAPKLTFALKADQVAFRAWLFAGKTGDAQLAAGELRGGVDGAVLEGTGAEEPNVLGRAASLRDAGMPNGFFGFSLIGEDADLGGAEGVVAFGQGDFRNGGNRRAPGTMTEALDNALLAGTP